MAEENRKGKPETNLFGEWIPKTKLGEMVKNKEIADIEEILDKGLNINEAEIVDILVPDLESDLLLLGQSKGKFGGGKRRAFRQTQKKTKEGNKPKFTTCAVVGNGNGLVGIGFGKSKETVPAREKSLRNAKLDLIKISRGCGSWDCTCLKPHTIPFKVSGKCSSVTVELIPAPKGTGLKAEKEVAKILEKAGIVDVWSKARGMTTSRANLIKATFDALKNISKTYTLLEHKDKLGLVEGKVVSSVEVEQEEWVKKIKIKNF